MFTNLIFYRRFDYRNCKYSHNLLMKKKCPSLSCRFKPPEIKILPKFNNDLMEVTDYTVKYFANT